MRITLKKLTEAVTFENPVRVQIWDSSKGNFSFDKLIKDFTPEDSFLYDLPVDAMGVQLGYSDLETWILLEVTP